MEIERPFPMDPFSEKAVLSGLPFEPSAGEILAFLTEEDFVVRPHKLIFTAMKEAYRDHGEMQLPMVVRKLEGMGKLAEVGGFVGVSVAMGDPGWNAGTLSRELRKLTVRRQILKLASAAMESAGSGQGEVTDLISQIQDGVSVLTTQLATEQIRTAESILDFISEGKPLLPPNRRERMGSWGMADVDEKAVIPPGEPVLIGARPGCGKTALGIQIAVESIRRLGAKVMYVSLELGEPSFLARLAAFLTGECAREWKRGHYTEDSAQRMFEYKEILAKLVTWYPPQGTPWPDIEARIRKAVRLHGVDLVVIDYFRYIGRPAVGRGSSEAYSFAKVSEGITGLTKELAIGMVVLQQLKQDADPTRGKRPCESDFADTDQPYRDCNIAAMLYRNVQGETAIYFPKNRDNQAGIEFPLDFDGTTGRFSHRVRMTEAPRIQAAWQT